MAKFLDGAGVQSALTDIIKKTQSRLVIVSPFLKIPVQIKHYLASIDKRDIPITIIYRTNEKLMDEDLSFFAGMKNLSLAHCENLHSKCYLNESEGLITSMNLYEYPLTHNWEMGVRFTKASDPDLYAEVKRELEHMVSQTKRHVVKPKAAEVKPKIQETPVKKPYQKTPYKPTEAPNKGIFDKIIDKVIGEEAYCIRCGKTLEKFDLQSPYCDKCHASWAKYKNPKYKEKFCHACGSEKTGSILSFEKPICKSCYTAYYKK